MTIPLSEINTLIQSIKQFIKDETIVHIDYMKSFPSTHYEGIETDEDYQLWLQEINQQLSELELIADKYREYRSYETERVSEYKKRLWIQFYEDLPEDMKEKINVDKTIDFDYP